MVEGTSGRPEPRWWTVRPAANLKAATYRCPFCNGLLPSLSEHVLVAPEGDSGRRRHAHTDCVRAARANGRLPSYDEWRGESGGIVARLRRRLGRS